MTGPAISDIVLFIYRDYTKPGFPGHSRMQGMGDNFSKCLQALLRATFAEKFCLGSFSWPCQHCFSDSTPFKWSTLTVSISYLEDPAMIQSLPFFIHQGTFHWWFKHMNYIAKQ